MVAGKEALRGFEVSRSVCRFVRTRKRVDGGGKAEGGCRRNVRRWGRVCLRIW